VIRAAQATAFILDRKNSTLRPAIAGRNGRKLLGERRIP
jgi:hypothetical protein